jgi:hypothetical protein
MYYYGSQPTIVSAFSAEGVDFDGTNDYLTRGADLTSNADGKLGLFSCWFWFDDTGVDRAIWGSSGANIFIFRNDADNKIYINIEDTGGTVRLNVRNATGLTSTGAWHHIAASWSMASAGSGRIFINGATDYTESTYTDATLNYTNAEHAIGSDAAASTKWDGRIGELYLNLAEYLDLASGSNVEKFILDGAPVDLGADGSTPTGSQPIVYLSRRTGDAETAFATNRGFGGNFTINGTLTDGGAISL